MRDSEGQCDLCPDPVHLCYRPHQARQSCVACWGTSSSGAQRLVGHPLDGDPLAARQQEALPVSGRSSRP